MSEPTIEERAAVISPASCPYYIYFNGGPKGVCQSGCREEPMCVTEEPEGGWEEGSAMTDNHFRDVRKMVSREEREELRRLHEIAVGTRELGAEYHHRAGKAMAYTQLTLPRLLDTIDALEAENERLRAIANAALAVERATPWADYIGEPGESDEEYNARQELWIPLYQALDAVYNIAPPPLTEEGKARLLAMMAGKAAPEGGE